MTSSSRTRSRHLSGIALLLALALFVAWGFWRAAQPLPLYLQGQMEAREVDIAPKITARIKQVRGVEGQQVAPGQVLVEMDSPEVRAKVAQTEAAEAAAQAQADKAREGARPQEIEMARLQWQQAQSAAELAEASLRRVQDLFAQGLVAAQKMDEAKAQVRASRAQAQAAQAQYQMAQEGARREDRASAQAQAQARQLAGVVAEAHAALAETHLSSPVAGEVVKVLAKEGELSPQGVALVSVVDLADQWLVLNVREDHLQRFAKSSRFHGRVPALGDLKVEFEVYFLGVLPDFATWRATRANQGFDARTFEVRARSTAPVEGARPGMSVVLEGAF